MKKTSRLNVSYDPIHSAFSLIVESGSLLQVHSAETDTYIPDRTLTPVILTPYFNVVDVTGITPTGRAESKLVDIRWYVGSESEYNMIIPGFDGFTINGYKLSIERNISYQSPLTIIFTANYFDIRTGHTIRLHDQKTLSTTSLTEKPVTLELDKSESSWTFDPIHDTGMRVVTASMRLAGNTVAANQSLFWWYKIISGVETLVDPDVDLWYESGQDTSVLTIDPRYVNGSLHLRCKGEYVAPGQDAPEQPTATCQTADTTIVRRYSAYDFEFFVNGSSQVSYLTENIKAEAIIRQGNDVLDSPTSFFLIEWLMKRTSWNAEWKTLGYGENIVIPKSDYINGADLAVDVHEKEPLKAASDNGTVLAINGSIITL